MTIGVVWFRQDLRLADNPALNQACKQCKSVLCVFIDDPLDQSLSQVGEASRVWLQHALQELDDSLRKKGNFLYLVRGEAQVALQTILELVQATHVYWNRCYDPATIARDVVIKSALKGYEPATSNALLVLEPWENLKADGSPYRVFTPFWRAASARLNAEPGLLSVVKAPRKIPAPDPPIMQALTPSLTLDQLQLVPDLPWPNQMVSHWQVGESAAAKKLTSFLEKPVYGYGEGRNLPAKSGTSKLSPHLHFGEISPRTVLVKLLGGRPMSDLCADEEIFAKEIIWREFAYSLLFHFPNSISEPMDVRFAKFNWEQDTGDHLLRWQRGLTGVPIVDAGMRELYATGWMHNRVRMIVASYLVKNLQLPWQAGENWFRNTLVDADLASNAMGWQWTAGCGADAAPFFRVFNPVLQGEKFDRQGEYVRHWIPELRIVSDKFVHKPWELGEEQRAALDYPPPLVDLKRSRQRALDAFAKIKGTK